MGEFKNFIILIFYLYLLSAINKESNLIILTVVIFFTVLYFMKYIHIKSKYANVYKIAKSKLAEQREYFTNILSHDIRIPIIAQIRAIELLKNSRLDNMDSNQKDLLCHVEKSCKTVLNITSLLINTYNYENFPQKLFYERFNLSELISSSFEELSQEATEKNITFEHMSDDKPVYINADKTEIKKVFLNILLSAVINANNGNEISVQTSLRGKNVRISFTIKGCEYCSNLGINTNYTSVGQNIRMFFCKKIIEFHKGRILSGNNRPNLFSFEIPREAVVQ